MTSLKVCHSMVIFYIPTKFHDDRETVLHVYVFQKVLQLSAHLHVYVKL